MRNIQPIEKADMQADHSLLVHSLFYTIQGEGPLTGHPAVFVRLAGCNLQCPGCDTNYTGPNVTRYTPEGLVAAVQRLHGGPRLVVITGGEPFRQSIGLFVQMLYDADYHVQIETNGTLPVPAGLPQETWIVVSPKAGRVHATVRERAVAWKYVLQEGSIDREDGLPVLALEHTASPRVARPPEDFPVGAIYVQPMDETVIQNTNVAREARNALNLQSAVRTCMKHGYTLQLQLHKILDME